ncbi:MAG: FeoB-associated Cys-rich membrane protein [Kiritimatiellae bacterium]|nr:FeoB-associated Cys-rich membrane protein [Kiritimatiellia bacterium]
MKIAMIIIGAIVLAAIAFSIWSRLAYRRWRNRFDAMTPDEQRKEQERMYKVNEWMS